MKLVPSQPLVSVPDITVKSPLSVPLFIAQIRKGGSIAGYLRLPGGLFRETYPVQFTSSSRLPPPKVPAHRLPDIPADRRVL
jgi:hypothetical protein